MSKNRDVSNRKRRADRVIAKMPNGIEVDGELVQVRVAGRSGYLVGIKKRHRQVRVDPFEVQLA